MPARRAARWALAGLPVALAARPRGTGAGTTTEDEAAGCSTIGREATVAIADLGEGGEVSTATLERPIVAFVVGQQGPMGGRGREGSKITRLQI